MQIIIEQKILDKLLPIIENPNYKDFPNSFVYPRKIEKRAILFIGINPASSKDQIKLDSYELDQNNNDHPYFKRFYEISDYCKTPWTHLDLLYFRETNQNKIYEILKSENGVQFIWDQLQITNELIKIAEPKIIIVSNALARTFLGLDKIGESNEWLNYKFTFDNEIGTYRWANIPVFFSSMLTGQRALDNGSFQRLKWQSRRTLLILAERDLQKIKTEKIKATKEENFELASALRNEELAIMEQIKRLDFILGD